MKILKFIIWTFFLVGIISCEEQLEENIYSQLAPSNLFTSEEGITKVLNSAYANMHHNDVGESWSSFFVGSTPTEEIWGEAGSIASRWVALRDFTWDANHTQVVALWTTYYYAIRDANIILDNIENESFNTEFIVQITAEAKFIRGYSYAELYKLFGPVPIYTSTEDEPLQARASAEELRNLIESDLQSAITSLPTRANTPFGRATKGAARAALMTFNLNTKEWQKAADYADEIIKSNEYALEDSYARVFSLDNEGNPEIIYSRPKIATGPVNNINALVFPNTSGKFPFPYANNAAFAARTYLFDSFVETFDENDARLELIITEWTNTDGVVQEAYGSDKSFPAKYPFDPNSVGANDGNDIPVWRYSDVLLSKAEALNEINGPSQEIIDLVNEVRSRASAPLLALSGLTKEILRNIIK